MNKRQRGSLETIKPSLAAQGFRCDGARIGAQQPPKRAPEYPGYGNPCNGCGLCCATEPCQIAREFAGITEAPCRAMQFEDGRFVCGMVKNPSRYMDTPDFGDQIIGGMFAEALGIGRGCDSDPPPSA